MCDDDGLNVTGILLCSPKVTATDGRVKPRGPCFLWQAGVELPKLQPKTKETSQVSVKYYRGNSEGGQDKR